VGKRVEDMNTRLSEIHERFFRLVLPVSAVLAALVFLLLAPASLGAGGSTERPDDPAAEEPAPGPGDPPAAPQTPLDLADRERTMAQMLNAVLALRRRPVPQTAVFDAIAASPDSIYTAPLVDALFFVGGNNPMGEAVSRALAATTGTDHGRDWRAYAALAGRRDVALPQGYAELKSALLAALVDPAFARFFPPGVEDTARINLVEVVWGGVRVDGIPSLVDAEQVRPAEASREGEAHREFCRETADGPDCRYPAPDELVFGVAVDGDARAYPLRILNWHEMFNDTVGPQSQPIMLAYCTLCGSGILYDTAVGPLTYTDPETGAPVTLPAGRLEFGSTGLLMRSNKLMYDRQTNTVWNAMTGRPAFGPLAQIEGLELEKLPVVVTDWESWLAEHPDTTVLSLDTGYDRNYTNGAAYRSYFDDPDYLMFPVWQQETGDRGPKDMVFGLELGGHRKAYPLAPLVEAGVVHDRLGDQAVVILARATPERSFFEPGGAAVRAYERGDRLFSPAGDGGAGMDGRGDLVLTDEAGARWIVEEDGLRGPAGERLARLPGHLAFWFGWYAFYPDTAVWEP
jgi:hypothetical protein